MTQINNIFNTKTVNIHQGGSGEDIAYITIRTHGANGNWVDAGVRADDLAKALEEALGWTIITEPLPEVTTDGNRPRLLHRWAVGDGAYHAFEGTKAAAHRARALADLALAKALEQQVDEAEVERFEHLIGGIEKPIVLDTPELARYLVQAGARAPENKEDEE